MPELPGINKPMLNKAIRDVWIEMCSKSYVWLEETSPNLKIRKDRKDYYVADIPECGLVHKIWVVKRGNCVLVAGRDYTYSIDKQKITLSTTPAKDEAKALYVLMILKPCRTATEIPCRVFEDWYEGVAKGVMARLKRQQGKSWSDPVGAQLDYSDYMKARERARTEFYKDRNVRDNRVRPRYPFFTNRRKFNSVTGDA